MDYRALAELAMFSLLGLSVFVVAVGFSVRAFIAPTLRELLGSRAPDGAAARIEARLARLEERLDDIDRGLERIESGRDFDRQLERPKLS